MISWSDFENLNPNTRDAFELMCRFLFSHRICGLKSILHSNPNNPGIEVLPYLLENGKKASFQSKFFEGKVDYSQIKDSFKKAVQYYRNQLDVIYLYCNKDITVGNESYRECSKILEGARIELISITGPEILIQAEEDHIVRTAFFGKYILEFENYVEQVECSFRQMGKRYNRDFNVCTPTQLDTDLFCQNHSAFCDIKTRNQNALVSCQKYSSSENMPERFIRDLQKKIAEFLEVENLTIRDFVRHNDELKKIFENTLIELHKEREKLQQEIREYMADEKKKSIGREKKQIVYDISMAINIWEQAVMSEKEQQLAKAQILLIQGEAGTGKSQLFAQIASNMLKEKEACLLLLGHTFRQSSPVQKQILQQLELEEINFKEFLEILEERGEKQNHQVLVFVDAINESRDKEIWKDGLLQLATQIKKFPFVKFAFSYRTGYGPQLIGEQIEYLSREGQCCQLTNNGFAENTEEAIDIFLTFYRIPFIPSIYFFNESSNPLYLMLFCQVFSENILKTDDLDISELFYRVLDGAEREALKAVGIIPSSTVFLMREFFNELISVILKNQDCCIDRHDLLNLRFWNENGLENKKLPYINSLINSNILIEMPYKNDVYYQITYNLLQDYLIARHIANECSNIDEICSFCTNLLNIHNGHIGNTIFVSTIPFVCEYCYEHFHYDCIDDLLKVITDEFDKEDLCEKYVHSFSIRGKKNIDVEKFCQFTIKHRIPMSIIFEVLISTSTKPEHPLNVHFLDKVLFEQSLARRDASWTIFINDRFGQRARIYQLIQKIEKREEINLPLGQIELLLLLFSWVLTSSNRTLRDKCSKALIEILRNHFEYCVKLLRHFQKVDDPYVIQRIYGIIFGAVMKRTQNFKVEFEELAQYVYQNVFLAQEVFPDILLRDYARLIVERWLHENKGKENILGEKIDIEKIRPPYKSQDIPQIDYNILKNEKIPFERYTPLTFSMAIDCSEHPGVYGDFGRYVFQRCVQCFDDINMWNIYLYAIDYIYNKLGYNNNLENYDEFLIRHDRHDVKKLERIGKKYQWIALYNVLAKISDNHLLENQHHYQGAWDIGIRDFDPTFNQYCKNDINAPMVLNGVDYGVKFPMNFAYDQHTLQWLAEQPAILDLHKNKVIFTDNHNEKWCMLGQIQEVINKDVTERDFGRLQGRQKVWRQALAYFVKKVEFKIFKNEFENEEFLRKWSPEGIDNSCEIYNRELYWAPALVQTLKYQWCEVETETGEFETIKYENLLNSCHILDDIDFDEASINDSALDWCTSPSTYQKPCTRPIGKVLPAYCGCVFGKEYDASQDETASIYVPCAEFVNYFNLEQKEVDGYFYDDDTLVAFNGNEEMCGDGVVVRFDYLKRFLSEKGYELFWILTGEKEAFLGDSVVRSEWNSFAYLKDENVVGNMKCYDIPTELPR